MTISNRLPETDDVTWRATMMLDGGEETLTLDLPAWYNTAEVQEAFIAEANDTYALEYYPQILMLESSLGVFS